MSLGHGASIVRDGLILHLDAANVKSYPGANTTWYDISGNNNHFTLNGVTLVESPSKHFSFGDNEGDSIVRSETDVIGGLDKLSIEMFIRLDTIQAQTTLLSYAVSTQNNNEFLLFQDGQTLVVYETAVISGNTFNTSNYNVGNFILLSVTRNLNVYKVYVNGTYITQWVTGSTTPIIGGGAIVFGQEQDTVLGSYSTAQDFPGDIASIKIYNRDLSETEIRQNFEALRGRYGI